MKKIILTLLVISMVAVLGVGLVACNNATPQGQLSDLLSNHNHEVFEYDVQRYDVTNETYATERGTYTVKLDAFKKGPVELGSRTIENAEQGIRVTGKLVFGTTEYDMGCYYNLVSGTNFMVPAYSYRKISVDGQQTFEMNGKYNGTSFECERTVGDEQISDTLKLSGTVFDNNQFQQVLRSLPSGSFPSINITFSTPIASPSAAGTVTLIARGGSTEYVKCEYSDSVESLAETGINCYRVSLGRSTEVAGVSHTLFYAVDEVKYNGWGMKNILVKIIEPYTDADRNPYEMHYTLVSASLS